MLTEQCPYVIAVIICQFILGLDVQCLMADRIFAKLQRSKGRSKIILFCSQDCIDLIDDEYQLMIYVGDYRSSNIVAFRVTGILVKNCNPSDGQGMPFHPEYIDFYSEDSRREINLL